MNLLDKLLELDGFDADSGASNLTLFLHAFLGVNGWRFMDPKFSASDRLRFKIDDGLRESVNDSMFKSMLVTMNALAAFADDFGVIILRTQRVGVISILLGLKCSIIMDERLGVLKLELPTLVASSWTFCDASIAEIWQ